jgi:hypothetical protein
MASHSRLISAACWLAEMPEKSAVKVVRHRISTRQESKANIRAPQVSETLIFLLRLSYHVDSIKKVSPGKRPELIRDLRLA